MHIDLNRQVNGIFEGGFSISYGKLLSDDISAIAHGVAFRPCTMSHFLYSHWLIYPLLCVGLVSHFRVSSQSTYIHSMDY